MIHICDYCSALHWIGERTKGRGENSSFMLCCKNGDISLQEFMEPPDFLRSLLLGDNAQARAFCKNVRAYNSAFAFTSIDCTTTDRGVGRGGPTCFQICGALYHITGPLLPTTNATPRYAQLYFYDPEVANNFRFDTNSSKLDRDIMAQLSDLIYHYNPLAKIYATAAERVRALSDQPFRINLNPRVELVIQDYADLRRENLPIANLIYQYTNAWTLPL